METGLGPQATTQYAIAVRDEELVHGGPEAAKVGTRCKALIRGGLGGRVRW